MNLDQYAETLRLATMTTAQLRAVYGDFDVYTYELDFFALASGAEATQSLVIQQDSHFLWERAIHQTFAGTVGVGCGVLPLPNCEVEITDTASGRTLQSAPVFVSSVFGNTVSPFVLPVPRFMRANTQLSVRLINQNSAAALNVRLSFAGKKFFRA